MALKYLQQIRNVLTGHSTLANQLLIGVLVGIPKVIAHRESKSIFPASNIWHPVIVYAALSHCLH